MVCRWQEHKLIQLSRGQYDSVITWVCEYHLACVCMRKPAVDVMYECVDDVSEDEGPGSTQTVLQLSE